MICKNKLFSTFLLILFIFVNISHQQSGAINATSFTSCICTAIYQPVCGVNGYTYSNPCIARCAGVAIKHYGPCNSNDICTLRPQTGPCKGAFTRYYYDSTDKTCKKFSYGGCPGNANNFLTESQCYNLCHPRICKLPRHYGSLSCNLNQMRWYYNILTHKCEKFQYSGCGGNQNNFLSEEQCIEYCGGRKTLTCNSTVCDYPPKICYPPGNLIHYYCNKYNSKCYPFKSSKKCIPDDNNYQSLDFQVTYYDFKPRICSGPGVCHPDFENVITGVTPGIVSNTLDALKKPVYASGMGSVQSAASFNQWYRSVPNVNRVLYKTLTFGKFGGWLYYLDGSFFPIDPLPGTWPDRIGGHNYHFTMELHTHFVYKGGELLYVAGDDDIWVFIDNKLVIDLGGVHPTAFKVLNIDTLGLIKGRSYCFDMFFAERHTIQSSLFIYTNLGLLPTATVPHYNYFETLSDCQKQCKCTEHLILYPNLVNITLDSIESENECNCPDQYAPVCGENGRTYDNACKAQCEKQAYKEEPCKNAAGRLLNSLSIFLLLSWCIYLLF